MKKSFTVGLLAVSVVFFANSVQAQLICGEPAKTIQEWVDGADMVAVGEFVGVVSGVDANGNPFSLANFKVGMYAKGSPSRIVSVESVGSASCPPVFGTNEAHNGQSYVIFAHVTPGGNRYSVGNGEVKNTSLPNLVSLIGDWKPIIGKR
jgi:hypothetical protein